MMPLPERARSLPTTWEQVPGEFLSLHLAQWRGTELRPLVRQRLQGLMRPDMDSISLNDEGVLRVILSGDAVSAQLALLGEPQAFSDGALLIYCDLRELFDLPDDIEQLLRSRLLHGDQPLDALLQRWLLETVAEPDACVELGLVSESASAVLEEFLEQQDILNRQGQAIELLSGLCEAMVTVLFHGPEKGLTTRVIDELKSLPPQGMVDGEPSYWGEIYGFTNDLDEMPRRVIEDVRKLARNVVESLPNDLYLAIQMREMSVHEWIQQKIEDDEVPLHRSEMDFDSEELVQLVVEGVLNRAVNFDPSLRPVSLEEAEALCLSVIEGREDLWASDLSPRLVAVGTAFPDMALFEQAAHVYSDCMLAAARRALNQLDLAE